jgi:hypothetical protein
MYGNCEVRIVKTLTPFQGVGWVPVEATEKDEPFKLFGMDSEHPFCTKFVNESILKFTYGRNNTHTFTGAVQTCVVLSMNSATPVSHSFLKWQIESCEL